MSSEKESRPRTGADDIVDVLQVEGVDRLYVYPGGTIAPVLDCAKRAGIDIFCARHEQGAGYAALARARLRQKPQVAMVTSGPGVTNLVTTIADAYYDSTPLVVLTGQVGTGDLSGDLPLRQKGFQEVDTVALLRPVTKGQFQPQSADQLVSVISQAFKLAIEGRPGPVLVDLPMDVQRSEVPTPSKLPAAVRRLHHTPKIDDVKQLAQWLMVAHRPVIIAGQGVIQGDACGALRELVERGGIPVSHSLLGLGAIPSDSEYCLGFHGHTGNQYAGKAIHNADLIIAVGSRLDVRQTGNQFDRFAPDAKLVRIDIDVAESEHGRVKTDLAIVAEARHTLESLNNELKAAALPDWSEWRAAIAEWRNQYPLEYGDNKHLKPQQVVETAASLCGDREVVCVTGVGAHQHWVARHFCFDYPRRRWLTSGGHGAMGYDLPSAIGAQIDNPDALVMCFVGDGSLQINIQELAVLAERQLPVKVIVLNNHRLGIVSQFQKLNWRDDPTTGEKWNPDFALIAKGYGIESKTIDAADQIERVLKEVIEHPGPVLVNCLIDEEEDISPMLMAGQTLDGMWPYEQ